MLKIVLRKFLQTEEEEPFLRVTYGFDKLPEIEFNKVAMDKIDLALTEVIPASTVANLSDRDKIMIYLDGLDHREQAKLIFEKLGLPYLNVWLKYKPNGELSIETVQNRHAIYDIDQKYISYKRDDYNLTAPEEEKTMKFVSDMISSLVPEEEKVPLGEVSEDEFERALNSAPDLRDAPVRQIVDANDDNVDRITISRRK